VNRVQLYTTAICPYCVAAKNFLVSRGLSYEEIRVDRDPAQLTDMIQRTQRRTVPQIFINDHHVGGYDDLVALDRAGGLAPLLRQE
jgi:glutaredoxin 3